MHLEVSDCQGMMWAEDLMLHHHCVWVCFFTLQ
jgi:hypothetical protein